MTPQPSTSLSLNVGDRVVYPNQGVCRVFGIEVKEVAGQKLTFVSMRREEDNALVMVPEAKVRSIGLRRVATKEEVEQIYAFLRSDSDKADLDWKQRARANLDRMSQGGIQGLAEVVKGLQVLSELRPLPNKERELYDNARHLLVSEISASLTIPPADAEDSIDIILFPVGKERPKRTAAEFRPGGEDELALPEDDLGIAEDEEAEEEPKKVVLSDEEITESMGHGRAIIPEEQVPPKRKRGRPPKPRPEQDIQITLAPPKKRGRPPKPKPAGPPPPPKKRGRPPKAAQAETSVSKKAPAKKLKKR